MDLSRSEALDKAAAALETLHTWQQREVSWDTPRAFALGEVDAALRALITEHRRLLAELDEAHAHFQVQEARIRALTEAGTEPGEDNWEYAVRQHDGRVWDLDLDDEPWTQASAFEDAGEILGGHVVRRRVTAPGPWEPVTPRGEQP